MAPQRSDIWFHFEVITDKVSAKCQYCKQVLSTKNGSMGNLNRHMKTKHPTINIARRPTVPSHSHTKEEISSVSMSSETRHIEGEESGSACTASASTSVNLSTASSSIASSKGKKEKIQSDISNFAYIKKPLSIARNKELDKQLLRWIVKGYHAFRIVEEGEFQKFCEMLCPNYKVPSRKTLSNNLLEQLYQSSRDFIQEELSHVNFICITTDSWTSSNNENFTAITAHYLIIEELQLTLKSRLLDCFSYDEKHTAQNISTLLADKFDEWNIQEKIVCVVSDNAANIIAAVREGGWKSQRCFAHSINLLVQNGLKAIDSVLEKLKAIVAFFKRSSTALAKLKKTQIQMGLPELKLIQDVRTRWNSTLDMVSRACKIKDSIISTLALESPNLNLLTGEEWSVLEQLVDVLDIFKEITNEISAEKTITSSKIFIFVKAIYFHLKPLSTKPNFPKELKSVVTEMLNQFYKRFSDVENNHLLAESTILDPRFKKYGFKEESKYTAAVANLRRKLSANRPLQVSENNSSEMQQCQESSSVSKKSKLWCDFDENISNLLPDQNASAAVIIELDRYLSEPHLKREENPLSWWTSRQHVYPNLFEFVKKRLCIQATSVPCERTFSKAGLVLNERRLSLKSSRVSKILFLNANL